METIFVILGPTSSGKTSLALQLAPKPNAQIISADSRQVIKGMDIGTGKVPVDGAEKLPKNKTLIYGYDLVTPDQYFSSYDFAKCALAKVRQILDEKKKVFLVGGTGFYIDMFVGRIKPANINPQSNLRHDLEQLTNNQLVEILGDLNPQKLKTIDIKNNMRLMRAIEIEKSTQHTPPLELLKNTKFVYIGLTSSREILYQRADAWLETIWHNGLLHETKNLMQQAEYVQKLKGLVYKSAVAFLNGELPEQDAIQRAKFDLHSYIRRQQTYFKKNPEIIWFDISTPNYIEKIHELMLKSI